MAQDNVSVLREAYETLASRGVDAFSEYWTDDISWDATGGSWSGRQAGRRYLQQWYDLFDEFTTEPLEILDAGDDQVVIFIRYSGRSKLTGMKVPPEYFAILSEMRDGKIARAREYATTAEALAAARGGAAPP
ncbi:MAG TPA: nuclear transport factor 2 family protein [Thermoleophilaceae bacterium]